MFHWILMVNRAEAKENSLRQALKQNCHAVFHPIFTDMLLHPVPDLFSSTFSCSTGDSCWTLLSFLPSHISSPWITCSVTSPWIFPIQSSLFSGSSKSSQGKWMNNYHMYQWLLREIPKEGQMCKICKSETFSLLLRLSITYIIFIFYTQTLCGIWG